MIDKLNSIGDDVKLIKELLTGNGNPQKGIIVRLDRVETKIKRADWIIKTLFVGVCTAIGGLFVKHLK